MKPRYVHVALIGRAPLISKCTHSEPPQTKDARHTSCKPPIAARCPSTQNPQPAPKFGNRTSGDNLRHPTDRHMKRVESRDSSRALTSGSTVTTNPTLTHNVEAKTKPRRFNAVTTYPCQLHCYLIRFHRPKRTTEVKLLDSGKRVEISEGCWKLGGDAN